MTTNTNEQKPDMRRWDVKDCGEVGPDNAVWLHCENIEARDNMSPGTTSYLDFRTGKGRDTVQVKRLA